MSTTGGDPPLTRRQIRQIQEGARRSLVTPAPPKPGGRAGRNLPAAIGVGLGLLALVLLSLFLREEAFVVLALLATSGALWEFGRAVGTRGITIPLLPLWVGNAGMLVSAYTAGPSATLVAFFLTAGGVLVWRVVDGGGPEAVRDAAAGVLAAAYVSFLAAFAVLLLAEERGPWLVLTLLLGAVANDTGGYVAGVLFGKHPMAPSISPKKSWEGAAGSLVLAAGVGVGLAVLALDAPWWVGLLFGAGAVVTATVGDLAESLLKRDLGLKDMGTLLPGHGGILDRIDSMLMTAPAGYLLLTTFVS
ncbi:phosphatidate cytidylyltransferase [uncultured Georgenia sp.]|uniref:phosphatidate cytidylyltransferase n=1 Tax=uncultured Georgenia sp. TaxID=378209 RepID=UPI002CD7A67E|nr:phosphatidate cytidylyltransferase [Actinomycetaceae bacterium]